MLQMSPSLQSSEMALLTRSVEKRETTLVTCQVAKKKKFFCTVASCVSPGHPHGLFACNIFHFFPSNAFMASARSSNTFHCMLQTRVNWLINTYISHATSSITAEILPSVSKVAGVWRSLFWCLESVMLWRGIMGFNEIWRQACQ